MQEATLIEQFEQLTLRGELPELSRVTAWIQALAARYAISEKTIFAIDLCLEESLSNIIRHGYADVVAGPIVVQFRQVANELQFIIDDEAPHFQPQDFGIPLPHSLEELKPGGLGIPLTRRFADRVEWEPLANGNRLTLAFRQ